MKMTLIAAAIGCFALVAVSGCNKSETATSAPAPAPSASQDAGGQGGQILRPTGAMGAGGGSGPGGGIPSTYTAPPSNAPPGIQQQMQRMNGGFGNR